MVVCGNVHGPIFFSGCYLSRIDDKGRVVIPQDLRYKLVEAGSLRFTIALSMEKSLAIYGSDEIKRIVQKLHPKRFSGKFHNFITTFFSTMAQDSTCDKVGRVALTRPMMSHLGNERDVVISGCMNRVEIRSKVDYEKNIRSKLEMEDSGFDSHMEEALREDFIPEEVSV